MFAIQWFDPFMPKSMQPYKDGQPKGKFATKELAEQFAENQLMEYGAFDIPYEIVEI
jgi:hypothetical protein